MKQYLLTFEFRYQAAPKNGISGHTSKMVTVGVFDDLSDAINKGNDELKKFASNGNFTLKSGDVFKLSGLFGRPDLLVTNTCYSNKVTFFGKITTLDYMSVEDMIDKSLLERKGYDNYILSKDED